MKLRDMFYFIAFFFLQAKLLLQNEFNDTGAAVHPSEANLTFIRMHFASLLTVETADNPGHVWLQIKQRNKDAGRCLHTTVPTAGTVKQSPGVLRWLRLEELRVDVFFLLFSF